MTIHADNGYSYQTVSRWIKIRFNTTGEAYFLYRGMRHKFDNIERLHYPITWQDKEGKLQYLSGVEYITWFYALFVEIHPDGEYIRLWIELKGDE